MPLKQAEYNLQLYDIAEGLTRRMYRVAIATRYIIRDVPADTVLFRRGLSKEFRIKSYK